MTSSRRRVAQSNDHDASTAEAIGSIERASRFAQGEVASVLSNGLIGRPQRFHEIDERSYLSGAEIFAVRRHISAALDHLTDELIASESSCDGIQFRSAQTTLASN